MDALPASPAMEIIQNELSPTQQRLLNQFKTPERSARGMTGISQYSPELVPGGYGQMIQDAGAKYNIDPAIIAGLIETESAWNPNAVSSSGARGLTQFMPGTASDFGVDVTDPASAIDGAAKYLRFIIDTKGVDINTALYMYNAGPNHNRPYPIPSAGDENKNYLPKVLKAAAKYGYGKKALIDPGTMRSSIAQQL
jgi:soluble lytic murein transglycosylase-like protein